MNTQTHTKQGEVYGFEVIKACKVTEVKMLLIGCSESNGLIQVNDLRVE